MSTPGDQSARVDSRRADMKFTVIVCTYNYAHLLPDALRTLAAQTLPDFELLIVDDGSTDHTEEVVRQYSPEFRNCVYFKKPHSGLADTRNAGVRKATGTHLAFLDADDLWSPEYLEVIRAKFESSPQADIVFSDGFRILGNGLIQRPVFPSGLPPLNGPVNSVGGLFSLCNNYLPSGMVFLKSLYERIGPFDTRFSHGDDVDWVIRATMAEAYFVRVDQKLLLYRFHGGNMTTDAIAFLETWLKIYEERLKNSRLGSECERRARRFAQDYVLRLLGICSPAKGRSLLARTLETLPGDIVIRCAYLSTYLGSSYALRPLKWGRHLVQKLHAGTQQVDLTAPPEMIFQSL
jgi:glycosyltransferase involved in cell wall biosynthesis